MKYYYDLHLHSCLSPCGDMDMTPNNLVNMAKLLGLDVIALTDHNTSLNCEAAMAVGREIGLLVIPGMELTTSEDIHAVCLFPDLEKALAWNDYVDKHRDALQADDLDGFLKRYAALEQDAFDGLLDFCAAREIRPEAGELSVCEPVLRTRLKALLARGALGNDGYWEVMNREEDPAFQKALEVIKNWPEVF